MADKVQMLPGGVKLVVYDRANKPSRQPIRAKNITLIKPVPILSKMEHLRKDLTTWFKSGAKLVSREKRKANQAICDACQYWNPKGNAGLGECQYPKCGCTKIKGALVGMKCPIDKWTNVPEKELTPAKPSP
jgi:hypothetical protein